MNKIIAIDKMHLLRLISTNIEEYGNNCDLNHIDISNIKDMTALFTNSKFTGDMSQWDVSDVTIMDSMFYLSKFNGDISRWNVGNVKNMHFMFYGACFNRDISNWDVSNVEDMTRMFSKSNFKKDISKWTPINLKHKELIFDSFNAKIPYWAEVEDTPYAVKSNIINKNFNKINKLIGTKKDKISKSKIKI